MGAVRDATGEDRPDSDHSSYRVLRQLNPQYNCFCNINTAWFGNTEILLRATFEKYV